MGFTKAIPPIPSGMSESDLLAHLNDGWKLQWTHPATGTGTPAMSRAEAAWFCLKKS